MSFIIALVIGIVIIIAGVGLSLYYQGKALEATGSPDQQKSLGKIMGMVGIIWVAMALLYCAAVVILRISTVGVTPR